MCLYCIDKVSNCSIESSISISLYILKSHLELQREITLIKLAPRPNYFVKSFCLVYMNTFARFDEIPRLRSKFAGGGGGGVKKSIL